MRPWLGVVVADGQLHTLDNKDESLKRITK